ncbi:MAG: hypothetical protein LBD11_00760 [Candidatus Peribacteria bacterium]|nr:hypothetical protein [Candidatus Peribacteria bacterium]
MNGLGSGAIGVYKSPNGNYYSVFATVQDGYQAMIQEIEHRKTTTKKSRQSLSAFLGGRVLGKNGKLDPDSYYYHIAMSIAGGDLSIQEISTETLAKIIMIGEATREAYQQGGVNLQHLLTKQ